MKLTWHLSTSIHHLKRGSRYTSNRALVSYRNSFFSCSPTGSCVKTTSNTPNETITKQTARRRLHTRTNDHERKTKRDRYREQITKISRYPNITDSRDLIILTFVILMARDDTIIYRNKYLSRKRARTSRVNNFISITRCDLELRPPPLFLKDFQPERPIPMES